MYPIRKPTTQDKSVSNLTRPVTRSKIKKKRERERESDSGNGIKVNVIIFERDSGEWAGRRRNGRKERGGGMREKRKMRDGGMNGIFLSIETS